MGGLFRRSDPIGVGVLSMVATWGCVAGPVHPPDGGNDVGTIDSGGIGGRGVRDHAEIKGEDYE